MTEASKADGETLKTAHRLRRSITRLARRLRAQRSEHGVSGSKLSVLGCLFRGGKPMTATDLARLERLQPQSLTRIVAELEEQGLIKRQQDDADRRQLLIELTEAGRNLLILDANRQSEWFAQRMAAKFTRAEVEIVCVATGLLEALADENDASAS